MSECEKVLICGDTNARIEGNSAGGNDEWENARNEERNSQYKKVDENGKRVIKICEELGLAGESGKGNRERAVDWTFQKLLNDQRRNTERNRDDECKGEEEDEYDESMNAEMSVNEIGRALGRMADEKATGEDGVPIECVKKIYMGAGRIITKVMNRIWEEIKESDKG
ncbi:hypothetical protein PV326_004821 [Microctonus aethiopoides]|nr:hypothetical protein PV326_004821 [Microctonus aethiopoides]